MNGQHVATNLGFGGRFPGRDGCLSFLSVESKQTGGEMVFQKGGDKINDVGEQRQNMVRCEGSHLPCLE